jgi:hypothetical protein
MENSKIIYDPVGGSHARDWSVGGAAVGASLGLQSAPAINGSFTNIPCALSTYTNAISGSQQFFRLIPSPPAGLKKAKFVSTP